MHILRHKKTHKPLEQRKKHICEDCFMVYSTKGELNRHRLETCSERLNIEKHNCKFYFSDFVLNIQSHFKPGNFCELTFATKHILKCHIEGKT